MTDLAQRVRRRLVESSSDIADAVRVEAGGIVDDVVLAGLRDEVTDQLVGAGPLEPLLALDGVTDVLVNGARSVWFDRGYGMERAAVEFVDDAHVRSLAQRLISGSGHRIDDAKPYADAVLADGTRLHAVLPPLCEHPTLSLRVLNRRRHDLTSMVSSGSMSSGMAELLRAVVAARVSFVITGGTGTGKTTLLASLLGLASDRERLVLVEDAPELQVEHPHVVRLVTRGVNVEGAGAIGLRELVRQALRMRPDRLVVGEFRGAEVVELLAALNTGHEGGAATLHANGPADVPARLIALGALAALPPSTVVSLTASGLRVVIHLRRDGTARVVDEIGVIAVAGEALAVRTVWNRQRGLGQAAAGLARELASRGHVVRLLGGSA